MLTTVVAVVFVVLSVPAAQLESMSARTRRNGRVFRRRPIDDSFWVSEKEKQRGADPIVFYVRNAEDRRKGGRKGEETGSNQ